MLVVSLVGGLGKETMLQCWWKITSKLVEILPHVLHLYNKLASYCHVFLIIMMLKFHHLGLASIFNQFEIDFRLRNIIWLNEN